MPFAGDEEQTVYKVYQYRWLILSIFCSLEMVSQVIWVTYAPISDIASNYFGGGYYGSSTLINLMANMYLITFVPGTIFAIFLVKNFRFKRAMEVTATITTLGSLIRYIAAIYSDDWGHETTYLLMLFGQFLAGIAQPMFLNSPPAIASTWFSVEERDMATTIGSMFAPIGAAVGQVIPTILVTQHSQNPEDDDDFTVTGMADLMLVVFIMCLVPTILTFIFFQDAPITAPSQSTKLKIDSQKALGETSGDGGAFDKAEIQKRIESFRRDVRLLFGNRNYLILLLSFSIGVGFFNALLTLLNQLVSPFGYSNGDAGTFGAVFILFGLVGAGIIGTVMEKTHAYRPLLKGGVLLVSAMMVLFLCMLYSDNFWPLTVSLALLGFSMLPLLPIMMENCAECTYPVPEEMSMGILFAGSNVLGLGFIFALQYLLEEPPFGPPPFLPSNLFILCVILVALVILQFYNGEYKRLQNESLKDRLVGGSKTARGKGKGLNSRGEEDDEEYGADTIGFPDIGGNSSSSKYGSRVEFEYTTSNILRSPTAATAAAAGGGGGGSGKETSSRLVRVTSVDSSSRGTASPEALWLDEHGNSNNNNNNNNNNSSIRGMSGEVGAGAGVGGIGSRHQYAQDDEQDSSTAVSSVNLWRNSNASSVARTSYANTNNNNNNNHNSMATVAASSSSAASTVPSYQPPLPTYTNADIDAAAVGHTLGNNTTTYNPTLNPNRGHNDTGPAAVVAGSLALEALVTAADRKHT